MQGLYSKASSWKHSGKVKESLSREKRAQQNQPSSGSQARRPDVHAQPFAKNWHDNLLSMFIIRLVLILNAACLASWSRSTLDELLVDASGMFFVVFVTDDVRY